ncbi:hypothetical protein V5O48_013673, partial [Marasmius crinis-equi]
IVVKVLQTKPPNNLNPENLSQRDRKALRAMRIFTDAINFETADPAYPSIHENWSKRWATSFCRETLDGHPPSTHEDEAVVFEILAVTPLSPTIHCTKPTKWAVSGSTPTSSYVYSQCTSFGDGDLASWPYQRSTQA